MDKKGVKKLPYETRAVQAANAIVSETKRLGHPPSVAEIRRAVFGGGDRDSGAATMLIAKMVKDGFVSHKKGHQNDIRLTTLGREKLLGDHHRRAGIAGAKSRWDDTTKEERSQMMRDLVRRRWEKEGKPEKKAPVSSSKAKRKSFYDRAKEFAAAIEEKMRERGMKSGVKELAQKVYGTAATGKASNVLNRMVEEGWVSHKHNHQNDIELTDKGRRALLDIVGYAGEPELVQIEQEISDEARQDVKRDEEDALGSPGLSGPEDDEALPEAEDVRGLLKPSPEKDELPPKWEPELSEDEQAHLEGMCREWGPKIEKHVQRRRGERTMVEVPAEALLVTFTDLDLVLELSARGYKVTRQ